MNSTPAESVSQQPVRPAKDGWDKAQILAAVVGSLAIPVVLVILGHSLSQSVRRGESDARLVELALDILRQDPKATNEIAGLRQWAIERVANTLSLSIPPESARDLEGKRLPASPTLPTPPPGVCCIVCEGVWICGTEVQTACGSCSGVVPYEP
jgi:hypothetical protein